MVKVYHQPIFILANVIMNPKIISEYEYAGVISMIDSK
jgi:hypothetical protein